MRRAVKIAILAIVLALASVASIAYAQDILSPLVARWAWKAWGGGLEVHVYGGWWARSYVLIEVKVWNTGPMDLTGHLTVIILKYNEAGHTWEEMTRWEQDITVPSGETHYYLFGPWQVPSEGVYKVQACL